tara:strand:- start:8391 stop:8966 length:576 start_codon:yes stop_codon:yes gene_type:complete
LNLLKNYLTVINEAIAESDLYAIDTLYRNLKERIGTSNRIFFVGNGGSASVATHAVTDLSKLNLDENRLVAISLNDNVPLLTATANDYGYENIYTEIIKNYEPTSKDLLIAISSSGNSSNVLNIVEFCNNINMETFALIGFDGGKLKKLAKNSIHIKTKKDYYGPVEDSHMIIFHLFVHIIKNDISELKDV